MKFLLIVCGLLLALGGVMASCGPQQSYCPTGPNGTCANNSLGGSMDNGSGGTDQGDATIITGGTGGM